MILGLANNEYKCEMKPFLLPHSFQMATLGFDIQTLHPVENIRNGLQNEKRFKVYGVHKLLTVHTPDLDRSIVSAKNSFAINHPYILKDLELFSP